MSFYAQLIRHRWQHLVRGGAAGPEHVKRLILGFFGVYFAGSLATIGYVFPGVLNEFEPDLRPAVLVNGLAFSALFAFQVLRFFTQRTTKVNLTPYLARPLPRTPLVRFIQLSSLSTLLNVFAVAFVVPLWFHVFLQGSFSGAGAWTWLAGVGLFVLATHYANNALRLLLAQRVKWLAAFAGSVGLGMAVDSLLGTRVLSRSSAWFFEHLLAAHYALLLVPAGLAMLAWAVSSRLLHRSLRHVTDRKQVVWSGVPAPFSLKRGSTRNLMLLELKLIARNRRPYTLVGISTLLIVTYAPLLLLSRSAFPVIDAVAGLFVSGILAASYGQLMFSWDSPHFDGLLTRPHPVSAQMRAKLLLLQIGCAASMLVALPFFVWLAPDLLLLSTGFLLYNVGITCPFVLFFSLWNRKRLGPQRSGFFNYEGLSVQHWIGTLPIFVPPLALLLTVGEAWVLVAVTVVGLLGMALLPTWTMLFSHVFTNNRHAMATGFRQDA